MALEPTSLISCFHAIVRHPRLTSIILDRQSTRYREMHVFPCNLSHEVNCRELAY